MRRYWVDTSTLHKNVLDGEVFHHIVDVCRQSVGSRFELLCDGSAVLVEIIDIHKKQAAFRVLEQRKLPEIARPHIHLCVSIPKLPTFELILEKSVELGTASVWPFVSDYSFVRDVNHERIQNKKTRWDKIIQSATQQTGRGHLMHLSPVKTLKEILSEINLHPNSVCLFPYEGECDASVKSVLKQLKSQSQNTVENIWIFVGSEGGFSDREVADFKLRNIYPASLGDQILRVETACLSLLSIVRYEFQEELVT